MKYDAALFDMDGVILDSEPLHMAAFRAVLNRYAHTLSEDDYKVHFAGKTDEAGLESYFKFMNEEAKLPIIMNEKAEEYLKLASEQLVPYKGVVEVIMWLADHIPLALVTGSLRAEVRVALEAFGITDCFKVIVTTEDIKRSKPNPEGYRKAITEIGIVSERCVVIEDSPNGIKAALTAGVDCIAVTNTHTEAELREATVIVDQLVTTLFV